MAFSLRSVGALAASLPALAAAHSMGLPINPALGVPGFPDCVRAHPERTGLSIAEVRIYNINLRVAALSTLTLTRTRTHARTHAHTHTRTHAHTPMIDHHALETRRPTISFARKRSRSGTLPSRLHAWATQSPRACTVRAGSTRTRSSCRSY